MSHVVLPSSLWRLYCRSLEQKTVSFSRRKKKRATCQLEGRTENSLLVLGACERSNVLGRKPFCAKQLRHSPSKIFQLVCSLSVVVPSVCGCSSVAATGHRSMNVKKGRNTYGGGQKVFLICGYPPVRAVTEASDQPRQHRRREQPQAPWVFSCACQ